MMPQWIYNAMPKRFHIWRNTRTYWRRLEQIAEGDGDASVNFASALACAELNRRLGDDELYERVRRASDKITEEMKACTTSSS
jgi:hypothetical protein